ncbi:retrotransposable element Tf2 [Tanacetum coccineum]
MIEAPVLGLPDFNEPFIIETNASGVRLGAVLQQKGHPIAYLSKTLSPKHQTLSTNEKEFLAVSMALEMWRGYLAQIMVQLMLYPDLEIEPAKKHYSWANDTLLRKSRIMVRQDANLRRELLQYFYEGSIGGHSGIKVTLHKLCSLFYWKGMRKQVKKIVRECLVCQKCKPDLSGYSGLLQPLPIPQTILSQISMDFIEGLPKSQGKDVVMVVVDKLSKYAHFIGQSHPFTVAQIAQVFLDSVYKLHGLPDLIVSDRDKIFISNFWKELFKVLRVKLLMSTAYHPQTDGQTEVVNRCLEGYLRCMTDEHPKEWYKWLSLAELWGLSKVDAVDISLLARENVIQVLKFHLQSPIGKLLSAKLNKYKGPPLTEESVVLPHCDKEGSLLVQPVKLLDRKIAKKGNRAMVYGLVQWANGTVDDVSWEDLEKLVNDFPDFNVSS